jgi:hypothetical protein
MLKNIFKIKTMSLSVFENNKCLKIFLKLKQCLRYVGRAEIQVPLRSEKDYQVAYFLSNPKIPIWVNFGRSCDGRCWFVYYMFIWYILCQHIGIFFGYLVSLCFYFIFSPFWYVVPRKIWQTCSLPECQMSWRDKE